MTTCLLPLPGKPFGEQDGKIYFGHVVINILADDVDYHTLISKVENLSISKVVIELELSHKMFHGRSFF